MEMHLDYWTYIPEISRSLFLGSLLLFTLSSISFFFNKKIFLPLLGMSAFAIGCAFALAVPWLYPWDEQFHALVGKNLAHNPFHPILIDLNPSVLTNKTWADQHTWLHKQPLFLYQIALSIKLLGNTAFAVRFPSILLHVVGTYALFDMGKTLYNRRVGFLAASLFLFSFYPLGMLSGRIGTDHNDSVFMVYVLLSFWAYFRYLKNKTKKWAKWIGIFVGLAILTKWVVGLLVFAPWGIFALIEVKRNNWDELKFMFRSLVIAFLIVIPWQVYIHIRFPKEANFELAYNAKHFFEALEGHAGNWMFHFDNLWFTFFSPKLLVLLLLISLTFVFLHKPFSRKYWSLWIGSVVLFLFFTISETKMYSFITPSYPLIILIISFGIVQLLDLIRNNIVRPIAYVLIGCFLLFKVFKPDRTMTEFGFVPNTNMFGNRTLYEKQLDFILKNGNADNWTVILNADLRGHGNIPWSFFTSNKAVHYMPNPKQIQQLKNQYYKIKCIQWNDPLPGYILNDKSIEIIPFE
jgi:4-amino-4-deoxy-L-arabinose transferase